MPFPPVANVIKLAMKFTTSTDLDIICNTHFKYSSAPPVAADLNTWLSAVATAYTNSMQALVPTNVTHVQDTATDLSAATAQQAVQTHSQPGTRAGGLLPISTCVVFVGKIQRRYRGGKPRNYWPFGTESDLVDDAHWSSTALSAFGGGFSAFGSALFGTFGGLVVTNQCNVSFYQGHFAVQNGVTKRYRNVPTLGPSPPYPYADNLTAYGPIATVGSQRRRLRPG